VIDYVTKKYGEGHVAQIVTFGTLGARAAIRDAGRALAMPLSEVNRLAGMIPSLPLHVTIRQAMEANADLKSLFRTDEKVRNLCETAMRLEGLARHASVHAAGVVISNEPLVDYTPLQRSADGGLVTQYPASTLEKIGLLKMDFLGLINLSILGKAVAYIEQTRGERIDVQRIPLDDSAAFELLGHGVTTGIFQLESAGMRRYVTELKPSSVRDLAAMVALYRPGPMAHIPTFIRAKHGLEDIKYPHPSLEGVLEETYGVIVYQDQVMRIAQEIAGYTLGQADLLRRAMGKKKKEEMAKERSRFLEGAAARGIPAKKAGEIFDLIEPFAGYAFNKAHAVCYAMIAYQTAYLKARYPVEYMAALMSCYIERADKLASCLEECRRMKIEVRSPDVNLSGLDFQPEGESIRFGLVGIKNVGRAAAERVMGAREEGPYLDLDDFCARVSEGGALTKATVEALVHCGAFDGLGESRQAMAEAVPVVFQGASRERRHREAGQFSLFVENGAERATAPPKRKYAGGDYASPERLAKERELLGVYLSGHPLQDVAVSVRREANCTAEELRERGDGEAVTLAGIVSSVKPFRSKRSGEPMAFITIEDMTGAAAVTVFPSVFRECESAIQKDRVVVVRGRASCRERVIEDTEGERNVEVLADEVRAVVAPASGGGSAVHIHLSPNVADRLRLVRSALEESPGAMPVFLYVPFGEEVRKVAAGLRVSPGDLLTRRLEELVGSGAVSVA
jgi:DNA polymerase-3 subunit alpha